MVQVTGTLRSTSRFRSVELDASERRLRSSASVADWATQRLASTAYAGSMRSPRRTRPGSITSPQTPKGSFSPVSGRWR